MKWNEDEEEWVGGYNSQVDREEDNEVAVDLIPKNIREYSIWFT